MNVLLLSPDFPPNYQLFARRLAEAGARAFGLGEADFYELPEDLRRALRWYVRCDLASPAGLDAGLERLLGEALVPQGLGRLERVASHNERWLAAEAHLNLRLGLPGLQPADLQRLQRKSVQKALFVELGLPVAEGRLVASRAEARALARELGYPLILKPDQGVGAQGVARVDDETQLLAHASWLDAGYLLERFIDGQMVSYDGLTDDAGRVLFESSLWYGSGVLEIVEGADTRFFVQRELPPALTRVGRQVIEAARLRGSFFHLELLDLGGDRYLPVELNARPPGGPILDMMNHSIDDDLYRAWAELACGRSPALPTRKRYVVGYAGRKDRRYRHDLDAIRRQAGPALVEHADNPPLYHAAMGRTRTIVRAPEVDVVQALLDFILATEGTA